MNYEKARGWWGPHSLFPQFQRGILSTWCLFQKKKKKKCVHLKDMNQTIVHLFKVRLKAAYKSNLLANFGGTTPGLLLGTLGIIFILGSMSIDLIQNYAK